MEVISMTRAEYLKALADRAESHSTYPDIEAINAVVFSEMFLDDELRTTLKNVRDQIDESISQSEDLRIRNAFKSVSDTKHFQKLSESKKAEYAYSISQAVREEHDLEVDIAFYNRCKKVFNKKVMAWLVEISGELVDRQIQQGKELRELIGEES